MLTTKARVATDEKLDIAEICVLHKEETVQSTRAHYTEEKRAYAEENKVLSKEELCSFITFMRKLLFPLYRDKTKEE